MAKRYHASVTVESLHDCLMLPAVLVSLFRDCSASPDVVAMPVGKSRLLRDDFAVAVARACFEAWTMSTSRRPRGGDAQCSRLEAEVAELRSELAESQQYRTFSQAKIKRLEQQLTEQEWWRFCSNVDNCSDSTGPPFSHSGSPVDQRLPDWQRALDRALLERDQARLEREEMRLELAALQAVTLSP